MDKLTKFLGPTKLEKSPKPRKNGRKNLNRLKPTPPKDQKAAKEAKQRLKDSRVPKPSLTTLTPLNINCNFQQAAQLKARTWADNCDMCILRDVDVNVLKARPKNTDELKSLAAQRIADMRDQLEDARSAIFKDKNGITLACVFCSPHSWCSENAWGQLSWS
ncbi:hypothetical protein B0H14DRAFT_3154244 [Mycena olivaceomarginata]|nr:hypothetical protein B0H14DRAFT_3154244 [Mycena olivaceomarginata]